MDKVICNNCKKQRDWGNPICADCFGRRYDPKEIDMVQISEEYYKKMCGEIGITISSKDIAVLIERGYIKEELKSCGWCGSPGRYGSGKTVSCSNQGCPLFDKNMSEFNWNKRA